MKKSYYTCFRFQGYDPKVLHCTHKFLGRITEAQVQEVIKIVEAYMATHVVAAFTPVFAEEAWFGPQADIHVVKTPVTAAFLLDLKASLDKFRTEDFAYNPHVTTPQKAVSELIISYALVENGVIRQEWPFKLS